MVLGILVNARRQYHLNNAAKRYTLYGRKDRGRISNVLSQCPDNYRGNRTMSAPELRLYNTLTREKTAFTPIDPENVRMYVCGPTVYDYAHIGNARPIIVFDVLYRLLRHVYGDKQVTYARNITDVDDKINARAAEERREYRRDYPAHHPAIPR